MKLTQWLLLLFWGVSSTTNGQIVPLFNIEFDSTCVPYTPLGNRFIINDALTYSWNFGNGTIINQKMPTYSYTQTFPFYKTFASFQPPQYPTKNRQFLSPPSNLKQ